MSFPACAFKAFRTIKIFAAACENTHEGSAVYCVELGEGICWAVAIRNNVSGHGKIIFCDHAVP